MEPIFSLVPVLGDVCQLLQTVTQLLGSTPGSQIQAHSSRHQKGMCPRTSMRTPHASSPAESKQCRVPRAPALGLGEAGQWGYETPTCKGVAAGLMQFPLKLSWGNGHPRAVLQPDPDTASREHRVQPGRGTFTPAKYPSPRWLPHLHSSLSSQYYLAPHTSADPLGARDNPKYAGPNPALALPGWTNMGQSWIRKTEEKRQSIWGVVGAMPWGYCLQEQPGMKAELELV